MIKNILKDSKACDFVDNIRQNQPKPRYGIECYHWETRKSGKSTKRVKVITHREYRQFNYMYWADWSREI